MKRRDFHIKTYIFNLKKYTFNLRLCFFLNFGYENIVTFVKRNVLTLVIQIGSFLSNFNDFFFPDEFVILGREPSLNFMDVVKIYENLFVTFGPYIELNSFQSTKHFDKICNAGTTTQVLASLIVMCLALIKLF